MQYHQLGCTIVRTHEALLIIALIILLNNRWNFIHSIAASKWKSIGAPCYNIMEHLEKPNHEALATCGGVEQPNFRASSTYARPLEVGKLEAREYYCMLCSRQPFMRKGCNNTLYHLRCKGGNIRHLGGLNAMLTRLSRSPVIEYILVCVLWRCSCLYVEWK